MAAFKTVVLSSLKTLSLWWMLFNNRLYKLYNHVSDIKSTQRVGRLKNHFVLKCIFSYFIKIIHLKTEVIFNVSKRFVVI